MNINRVNSGSGNPTSSARWFTPTSPINISDTFMIEVLPAVETDSVGVTATGAYYGSTRAVASISGTTLTVNKAISNDSTFAGWATDMYGYFKGGFFAWGAPFNNFFIKGNGVYQVLMLLHKQVSSHILLTNHKQLLKQILHKI